jgi:CRP/FNR family transcriptional regulator, cyclic AMP receptor protein
MGPDLVGYVASALVLLTFTAKSMLTLRILAILSNFAFICYGIIDSIVPVLCLHAILLPLNITRLAQLLAAASARDRVCGTSVPVVRAQTCQSDRIVGQSLR